MFWKIKDLSPVFNWQNKRVAVNNRKQEHRLRMNENESTETLCKSLRHLAPVIRITRSRPEPESEVSRVLHPTSLNFGS